MNKSKQKTRPGGIESLKLMIVALSLAATLFFWAVFSTQDQRNLVGDVQNPQPALVINLPPATDGTSLNGAEPVPTLRSVSQPQPNVVVPQGNPVIISGGGGGGGRTVTSTKAS